MIPVILSSVNDALPATDRTLDTYIIPCPFVRKDVPLPT